MVKEENQTNLTSIKVKIHLMAKKNKRRKEVQKIKQRKKRKKTNKQKKSLTP